MLEILVLQLVETASSFPARNMLSSMLFPEANLTSGMHQLEEFMCTVQSALGGEDHELTSCLTTELAQEWQAGSLLVNRVLRYGMQAGVVRPLQVQ